MLKKWCLLFYSVLFFFTGAGEAFSDTNVRDFDEIKKEGVLRHVGVPYAKFVTGTGDGLSVDIVKGFAEEIGVGYEFVAADFQNWMPGENLKPDNDGFFKGDIIEAVLTVLTVLSRRKKAVAFSNAVFPSQVWLVTRSDSEIMPIVPGKDYYQDILKVKFRLKGKSVLGIRGTCLDPDLYNIHETGGAVKLFEGSLNELVPAVVNNEADCVLLDVADTLIALNKWPGSIKVIGPVGPFQEMASAFRKSSPNFRKEYNKYLEKICRNGKYIEIVGKYSPDIFIYYPDFFSECVKNNGFSK